MEASSSGCSGFGALCDGRIGALFWEKGDWLRLLCSQDAFFVLLDDGCEGRSQAMSGRGMTASRGTSLDKDDETGEDLAAACQFMDRLHNSLGDVIGQAREHSERFLNSDTDLFSAPGC